MPPQLCGILRDQPFGIQGGARVFLEKNNLALKIQEKNNLALNIQEKNNLALVSVKKKNLALPFSLIMVINLRNKFSRHDITENKFPRSDITGKKLSRSR